MNDVARPNQDARFEFEQELLRYELQTEIDKEIARSRMQIGVLLKELHLHPSQLEGLAKAKAEKEKAIFEIAAICADGIKLIERLNLPSWIRQIGTLRAIELAKTYSAKIGSL
jgi:hypothetical protein